MKVSKVARGRAAKNCSAVFKESRQPRSRSVRVEEWSQVVRCGFGKREDEEDGPEVVVVVFVFAFVFMEATEKGVSRGLVVVVVVGCGEEGSLALSTSMCRITSWM